MPVRSSGAGSLHQQDHTLCAPLEDPEVWLSGYSKARLTYFSPTNAICVLDAYVVTRLAPNDESWTESTIITMIWLMTSGDKDESQVELSDCAKSFDSIHQAWRKALGAEATHSALVVSPNTVLRKVADGEAAILEKDRAYSSSRLQRTDDRMVSTCIAPDL